MDTITNKRVTEEPLQFLMLNRKLTLIEDFASKEGLATETIEQFGKLGIVQIRKRKGKTFVVDIPINLDEAVRNNIIPQKIKDSVTDTKIEEKKNNKSLDGHSFGISDPEVLEIINKPTPSLSRPAHNIKQTIPEPPLVKPEFLKTQSSIKNKTKNTWRIISLVSIAGIALTSSISYRLYLNRQVQLDIINTYGSSIEKMLEVSQKTNLQSEYLKGQLESSRAQIQELQNNLYQTSQELSLTHQQHAEKMNQLNKELLKLANPPIN